MFTDLDKSMMQRALSLAKNGIYTTSPNPNVGCVITKDDKIISEGFHFRAGEAHAEIHALRAAGKKALSATAYVTLEPCSHYGKTPPCANALIDAGITRVVIAMVDPNPQVAGQGIERLESADLKVSVGLLKKEAEALNLGFIKRMKFGLPFVQLKLAASIDGKTALANGQSKWITSEQARTDVQRFRAKACAILSTRATVVADDPALTVRYASLPKDVKLCYQETNLRQPLRVILDTQGRISAEAKLFSLTGDVLILTCNKAFQIATPNTEVAYVPSKNGKVNLGEAMQLLARRGINHLWVEAGAELAGSLLSDNLVDEILLYQAPKLMGSNAKSLVDIKEISSMSCVPEFEFSDVKQIGTDIRVILHPKKNNTHK